MEKKFFQFINQVENDFYDYENIALFCDPNYSRPGFFHTIEKGPYSPRRRCLYGKDAFEYVLEFSKKFLETYKNEKKIFKMGFNDAHESTGEVIRYMDESLKNFIKYYLKNHMTEKSMIIFLSDHGNAMPDLNELLLSQDKEIEKTFGFNDTYYNKEKSSPLDKEIDKSKRTCELYYDDFKFYSTDMKLCRCKNIKP